jgi:hypothetical protein
VLSHFIFTILLIAIGWLVYFITERKKKLRFFGIRNTKRIVIYLSNLRIISGGSLGVDNKPRTYSGTTVVYNEQLSASKFKEMFNFLFPSLSENATILNNILFSDIKVSILPSPLSLNELDTTTSWITFGSPGYNIASEYVENGKNSIVNFTNDNRKIKIDQLQEFSDTVTGFIQKNIDANSKRCLFYTAGVFESGTVGAANFLCNNWKLLNKKYGSEKQFIVLLRFNNANLNDWTIISEREI